MDKAKLDSCVEKSGFLAPPMKADADDPPLVQCGTPERGVKIPPPSDPSLRKIWESGVAERAAQGKGKFVGDACSKLDACVDASGKLAARSDIAGAHWTALQQEEEVWSVKAPIIGKTIPTATGHMAKVLSVRPDPKVGYIARVRYDADRKPPDPDKMRTLMQLYEGAAAATGPYLDELLVKIKRLEKEIGAARVDANPDDLIGKLVRFKEASLQGQVTVAGMVKRVLPNGKLEIKRQLGGYAILAPEELL